MKIICKKNNDANKMLSLVKHILEKKCSGQALLDEDLVLDISLRNEHGKTFNFKEDEIYLDENDIQHADIHSDTLEYYYYNDALTKLFNRGKYELDIAKLQKNGDCKITCVYIDAVGLHEINNHLGHEAGDKMLCCIADGIRQYFINCDAYRIGGDEFVLLCFNKNYIETKQSIEDLKKFLTKYQYEISVGTDSNVDGMTLLETINRAEEAMRDDKAQFYHKNGAKRQIRTLNHKLEKILLEKRDANRFLNVIAAEYKGVYMVNPITDTCRYIYIPEYFTNLLSKNNGVFSKAIHEYCYTFVSEDDREIFKKVLDYDYVYEQLKQGNQIKFRYEKVDGSSIYLQITIYDSNSSNTNEMLWIFMDGDQQNI